MGQYRGKTGILNNTIKTTNKETPTQKHAQIKNRRTLQRVITKHIGEQRGESMAKLRFREPGWLARPMVWASRNAGRERKG